VGCLTGTVDVFTAGMEFLFISSVTTGTTVATAGGRAVVSMTDAFCVGTGCGSTYETGYNDISGAQDKLISMITMEIFQSVKEFILNREVWNMVLHFSNTIKESSSFISEKHNQQQRYYTAESIYACI